MTKPQEPPLAQDLLTTEYGLRDGRRAGGAGAAVAGIWEQMWVALRRILDRVRGRSPSAPAGMDSSSAAGQEPGPPGQAAYPSTADGRTQVTMAEPQRMSPSEEAARERVASLAEEVDRLPKREREAFEDEVLHLVRNDEMWRKAFEESPESMPTVARYAVNAHLREALRDKPPEAVPQHSERPSQSPESESNDPLRRGERGQDQRLQAEPASTSSSLNQRDSQAHDSNALIAAQAGAHLLDSPPPPDLSRLYPPLSPGPAPRTPPRNSETATHGDSSARQTGAPPVPPRPNNTPSRRR
ncbi:hypothetical protein [Streptomyces sp. NBC_00878]|uniref:hypothetical protein n=1 Tax=Streptomyces sp. NBC_00878 TaxID=2975854 RepID=UPI00225A8A2F|nr:hypothetical protein [Streptomyces sp. NBC_00878]MCX4904439.1 hypothetical protein [Streptomyces sp. NBC_00878]